MTWPSPGRGQQPAEGSSRTPSRARRAVCRLVLSSAEVRFPLLQVLLLERQLSLVSIYSLFYSPSYQRNVRSSKAVKLEKKSFFKIPDWLGSPCWKKALSSLFLPWAVNCFTDNKRHGVSTQRHMFAQHLSCASAVADAELQERPPDANTLVGQTGGERTTGCPVVDGGAGRVLGRASRWRWAHRGWREEGALGEELPSTPVLAGHSSIGCAPIATEVSGGSEWGCHARPASWGATLATSRAVRCVGGQWGRRAVLRTRERLCSEHSEELGTHDLSWQSHTGATSVLHAVWS